MKLWLISQEAVNGYDTFDSAVVSAETEEDACATHPYGDGRAIGTDCGLWATDISQVKAKYLGEAAPGIEAGVILASFNAG